jgi:hypothetical protein
VATFVLVWASSAIRPRATPRRARAARRDRQDLAATAKRTVQRASKVELRLRRLLKSQEPNTGSLI